MSISLVKGQKIDLTKNNKSLKQLLIGLGWSPADTNRKGFFKKTSSIDLDSSVFMLRGDKLVNNRDIIYFGNLKSTCGGVIHKGDNLTGTGNGNDDEQILVDLDKIPQDVNKLVFVINIYSCNIRKQDFGMIKNAFIRIVNNTDKNELLNFNLTEGYSGKTAMIIGEVYRHDKEWKFAAIGEGTNDISIDSLACKYRG